MTADLGVAVLSGALALVGVAAGTSGTVWVQRSSIRESRARLAADKRAAQRAELKTAIVAYLDTARHLQTKLNEREHGGEVADLATLVEQVWLAQEQVDIICSEQLRKPVEEHASALNEVARHETDHSDWWAYVSPHSERLLSAMRAELRETVSSPREN
jgi:hypothetical protein